MEVLRGLARAARSIACTVVLLLALLGASLLAVLRALTSPRAKVDRVYTGLARLCLRVAATPVEAHGLDRVDPTRAYVIVPNHESNWDPLVLLAALDMLSIRFVVKRELMRIPIFGHALRITQNVRVERRPGAGDVDRIRQGMIRRDPGVSILFYAQGTRARDGSFLPFRKGAFATAISEKLPILPVATAGTPRIWRPGSFVVRPGRVVLVVGEPIPVKDLALPARDDLRIRTEARVRELRRQARERLRALGTDPGGID